MSCENCIHYEVCKDWCEAICKRFDAENLWYDHPCTNRFQAKSEWISVSERLPEPNELVLAVLNEPSFRLNFPYNEQVLILLREKIPYSVGMVEEWKRPFSGETVNYNGRVTHWMPLPEAPKMKEGAE